MNSLKTLKPECFLKTFLVVIAIQTVLARPSTYRNGNYELHDKIPILEEDIKRGAEFQQAMHKFLHDNEHKELRKMLKLAIRFLDNEDYHNDELEVTGNMLSSEMPFYFDHVKSLVNGEASNLKRRVHRKRSSFDSIGHRGGLSGLGGSYTRRKLEFTFENLLPYLIEHMRRNGRDISDVDY
ncbi:uncharacterized protein LOC123528307 [Mercenaria mercenaria]|uniref:uncharacterized protein LOC123528307 n=1 Tax=Mercenaria mercenaria TaxID=6596 RepID=UPI00234F3FE2|nr:uncharacterized protein LOC123528307 [Mercenaria mercenaria]